MNIAICDDNLEHINILEKELFEINKAHKIECDAYQSGESLIKAYKNSPERYDIVFLDMEMETLNGIETANAIREIDEYVIIVFITSHTEYMRESFKCSPFRFLLKPVDTEELKEVMGAVREKLSKSKKVLTFNENKALHRIFCEDIIYCESRDHYVYIHTKDETYKLCKSLSDLYKSLDNTIIFRVHSSFVVNFHYIKIVKNSFIELYHCEEKVPISRSYRKTTLEEYTNFVERSLNV